MAVKPSARRAATKRAQPQGVNSKRTDSPRTGGAKSYSAGAADRWQAYLGHHQYSAKDSLQRLLATPLQSLLTWLVIAVALALPGALFVGLGNLQDLGERWDGAPQLSVFINPRAKTAAVTKLQQKLEEKSAVMSVTYISPEQALADFEANSGLGGALRALDSNPLPPALVVVPDFNASPLALAELGRELDAMPLVDEVVFDQAWVERLHEILRLGASLSLVLGVLLALGVVLVIGNTIRLAIENRRDEIVVIKLVGGSDSFVRRPFLYTGLWYGVGGGLLALLLLTMAMAWLSGPVASLAQLYGSGFRLEGLGLLNSMKLLLLACLIGWLGAWLAVGRHLSAIEPR